MQGRPLPVEVYLDTSVFISTVVGGTPHSTAAAGFCQQLTTARSRVYYSHLVRVELLQALRRLATTRHNLAPTVRARYVLDRWGVDSNVRRTWLELGLVQFETLLNQLRPSVELPWALSTWQASAQLMIWHGFQANDALHAAAAQEYGIPSLAAVDDDYRRVPSLDFWLIRD